MGGSGNGDDEPCGLDLPHGFDSLVNVAHAFAAVTLVSSS